MQLLQEVNGTAYRQYPGIVTVAEESTSWSGVTATTEKGGLGFGFKWNMGWMNDALRYLGQDPIFRQYHHSSMTFALMYAFSENFVLPISHDEVVHGKGSLLRKSRGTRDEQLATLRAFLAYMWAHPGQAADLHGLRVRAGVGVGGGPQPRLVAPRPAGALPRPRAGQGHEPDLQGPPADVGATTTTRPGSAGSTPTTRATTRSRSCATARVTGPPTLPSWPCVTNFSGMTHEPYRVGVPRPGGWRVILDTAGYRPDSPSSAGVVIPAESQSWDNQPYAINVTVPGLSTVWLVPEGA